MKKIICIILFATVICAGVYSWYSYINPKLYSNPDFLRTDSNPVKVTVPLGGTSYVDIMVDGINTELLESNQLTLWKFNDATIMRTKEHGMGKEYSNEIMYESDMEVYRKYGDYYITVISDNCYVDATVDGFSVNKPYSKDTPELIDSKRITQLPKAEFPQEYTTDGTWKLPKGVREASSSKSSDDVSYYENGWYFNCNFRYQKHTDAVRDAATRVVALSHTSIDWWYDEDGLFVVKAGDEYACVKQDTYTSCYFISSNDLSYILLNI